MSATTERPRLDLSVLDRHDKIALSFSGGKDSLAVVYLLRSYLDRITIYHNDTGDLLPEQMAIVEHVKSFAPRFVHIQTNVSDWIAANGLPSDLIPHSAHPVGQAMGEGATPLVARYDCCFKNLMWPTYSRMTDDGNTLIIRGTKAQDMKRLPQESGAVTEGVELFYPLQGWSHAEVFAYLREVEAPISRVYTHQVNAPECARCPAWWSEGRDSYLKRYHPRLWLDYRARLEAVARELAGPLEHLNRELRGAVEPPALSTPAEMEPANRFALEAGLYVLQGNRLAPTERGHVEALLDMMVPEHGACVLDIGCGFGQVSRIMRELRPDLAFVMLNRDAFQLAQAPAGEGFSPVLGDMHAIPLPAASVDGAMALYAFCHADLVVALREASRVVRPGGWLFIYDYERTGGDNRLMEHYLGARAHRADDFLALARATGWEVEFMQRVGGDDSLFRRLVANEQVYRSIFSDLSPVVWRLRRDDVVRN